MHLEHLRVLSFPDKLDLRDPQKLTEGHPGAMAVISRLIRTNKLEIIAVIDLKHLYGVKIWNVYSLVCGQDIDRFVYHIGMELPCQICGDFMMFGDYQEQMTAEEMLVHIQYRTFGKPGSFWALEYPPQKPNYEYPIKIMVFGATIRS